MGGQPPKKRRTARQQGQHRSHDVRKLARLVNARSPVKVRVGKARTPAAKSS